VPGDFIEERDLDTVVGLVARSSQQDADKAAEWRHITVEQGVHVRRPRQRRGVRSPLRRAAATTQGFR
jgi:hypothetical protein